MKNGLYWIWLAENPTFDVDTQDVFDIARNTHRLGYKVAAEDLEDAFFAGQEPEHSLERSASVGDVIQSPGGGFYVITPSGFITVQDWRLIRMVIETGRVLN